MIHPALGIVTPSPFPSQVHSPLLRVLGRVTSLTPNVFVECTSILDDVIREAGYDPLNLPTDWNRTKRSGGGAGIDRNITLAFRYAHRRRNPALTVRGPKVGMWGLTEAGVKAARDLGVAGPQSACTPFEQPSCPGAPNETAGWLGKHLAGGTGSDLYRMMRATLARRLPVSASADMLDDHIQNFMVRAIRRNSFRKLLQDSDRIPYSKIVAYCVNSGRTDARDMGSEPICREMLGARTEKERRKNENADCTEDVIGISSNQSLDTDGNIVAPEGFQPGHDQSNDIDFDTVWQRIENVVHGEKPRAWERYSGIIAMKARGLSTREIARAESVSRNRAASMLAEARRCVRAGFRRGEFDGFLTFADGV